MNQSLWVYIWRFQPFHNGHKSIIDTMIKDNDKNLILIWVSREWNGEENPFPYEKRLWFILNTYHSPTPYIYPLIDHPSDEAWVRQILWIWHVQNADHIKFYCGDKNQDSAIKAIEEHKKLFIWKDIEMVEIPRNKLPISWTQIRHEIKQEGVESIKNLVPGWVYKQLKKTG